MSDKPLNENEAKELLLNPFYAIVIDKLFSEDHKPIVAEEDWVKANAKLIDEIGAEEWLQRLLTVLKGK